MESDGPQSNICEETDLLLKAPITKEEILIRVKHFKNNEAPGIYIYIYIN